MAIENGPRGPFFWPLDFVLLMDNQELIETWPNSSKIEDQPVK